MRKTSDTRLRRPCFKEVRDAVAPPLVALALLGGLWTSTGWSQPAVEIRPLTPDLIAALNKEGLAVSIVAVARRDGSPLLLYDPEVAAIGEDFVVKEPIQIGPISIPDEAYYLFIYTGSARGGGCPPRLGDPNPCRTVNAR